MKKLLGAILIAVFAVSAAQAEEGRMSRSKLDNLGLSSMQSVSDAEGMQVRGQGRMFISGAVIGVAGPSSASFTFGAQARTRNALGIGAAQAIADYNVLVNNIVLGHTATALGTAFAFAP